MVRLLCPRCGATFSSSSDTAAVCPRCGFAPHPSASAAPPTHPAAPSPTAPPAGYGFAGQPPPPVGGYAPSPATPPWPGAQGRTNGLAIAAMVFGILSLFLFFLVFPPILALVFGIVSLRQIKRRNEGGAGMAITGITLGSIVIGLALVVALIALAVVA